MDKTTFVCNMQRLIECQKQARIVSDAFGCDIDCEGFIGDLIDGYGTLILTSTANLNPEDISDTMFDHFWNSILNTEISDEELIELYEQIKNFNK